jgi:EAL domain-containing protein (putative c-di-GMP-specific phosphodiesterase class I)
VSLRNALRGFPGLNNGGGAARGADPTALTAESVAEGLRLHEFAMHFQPLIALSTGELVGAEALLRWEQPGGGQVTTARQFMSKALSAGVLNEMSESAVGPACEFACQFQIEGKRAFSLGVNLSATQLADGVAAVASVREALATSQLPPWCLQLELPERALLEGQEDLPRTLQRLAKIGVGIVIDDFWASERPDEILAIPGLSGVKLDVWSNTNNDAARAQLHTAAQLAKERGLVVTAKRVESLFEIEFARELECDWVQGHAYGRPMTADAFREFAAGMSRVEVTPDEQRLAG